MRRFSGKIRSAVIIGLQGIRARKLRTLLSMISLFLGVLAVVVVQAASQTAQDAALADVELIEGIDGTLRMYVDGTPEATNAALRSLLDRPDAVGFTSVQAIIGEPGVRPVNEGGGPFDEPSWGGGWGKGGPVTFECDPTGYCYEVVDPSYVETPIGAAIELRIFGMTGDIRQFRPFRPVSGQWLDFGAEPSFSPGLVLNEEAAKGFERYRVPAEMRILGGSRNPTPRIIGVVDDGQPFPVAYSRLDELMNWTTFSDPMARYYGFGLEVLAAPTATETLQILRANLAANGIGAERLYVNTIESRKKVEDQLAMLRVIFFGMAGLVLLIGVAGILNVSLASVGERIEEFALRRAVGTPRLLLGGIVLAETMIIGIFTAGAAVGVTALGMSVGGPILADFHYSFANAVFPWQAAVAGVIAGLVAGVLGGLIPAIRAARIPIATVMRA